MWAKLHLDAKHHEIYEKLNLIKGKETLGVYRDEIFILHYNGDLVIKHKLGNFWQTQSKTLSMWSISALRQYVSCWQHTTQEVSKLARVGLVR